MFVETKFFHKAGEGSGGGGGSDPHNLGYYADLTALQTAHPTGTDGDFAILGSTDTIWVWDSGTSAWKDTDTKGQVTSVNGQTGVVTVDTLPDQTGQSGKFLTTDGTDASWSDKPLVNTFSDSTSVGILSYENRAYPRNVVIGSNTRYTASTLSEGDSVWIGDSVNHPTLTSYWEAYNSVIIGSKAAAQNNSVVIGYNARGGSTNYASNSVCVGYQAGTNGGDSQIAVGYSSVAGFHSVAIGRESNAYYSSTYPGAFCIAIGSFANAKASGAIQIGRGTNSTEGTLQIGLSTGGYYGTTNQYVLLDSDGTIPEARLADTTNATTGDVLQLDSNGNAVWAAGGGGGGLPSQTGNSGKFLTTDGTDASWSDKPIVNTSDYKTKQVGILGAVYSSDLASACGIAIGYSSESRGVNRSIAIGSNSVSGRVGSSGSSVALGYLTEASGGDGYSAAIGTLAKATATGAIQFGNGTNSTPGTLSVGLQTQPGGSAATNYRLLDSDGTIPAARHATLPAADGTYTLQLVITNGVPTLSWVAV